LAKFLLHPSLVYVSNSTPTVIRSGVLKMSHTDRQTDRQTDKYAEA